MKNTAGEMFIQAKFKKGGKGCKICRPRPIWSTMLCAKSIQSVLTRQWGSPVWQRLLRQFSTRHSQKEWSRSLARTVSDLRVFPFILREIVLGH
jgi:hypothetical protein